MTEVGLSVADAPFGAPLAVRLIVSVEPLVRAVEMADVPVWPWTKERVVGLAVMEKSFGGGAAVTVSVTRSEERRVGREWRSGRVSVRWDAVRAATVTE